MTKPEKKFKAGACSASIFANEAKSQDGKAFVTKSVQLQRTYMDKNGTFQNTTSFRLDDIPKAILVLGQAFEYLNSEEGKPRRND